MQVKFSALLLLVGICLSATVTTSAQVVTFNLNGTLTNGNGDVFATGGAFTWTITMDLGAAQTGGSVNGSGDGYADYAGAVTALTFNYGNGTFVASGASPLGVRLTNHYTQDYYDFNTPGVRQVLSGTTPNGNIIKIDETFIRLFDITSNAFSSTALVSPVGRNWFTDGSDTVVFLLYSTDGTYHGGFTGSITSVSAIPEPSTYAAIVGGIALGGAMLRRRLRRTV